MSKRSMSIPVVWITVDKSHDLESQQVGKTLSSFDLSRLCKTVPPTCTSHAGNTPDLLLCEGLTPWREEVETYHLFPLSKRARPSLLTSSNLDIATPGSSLSSGGSRDRGCPFWRKYKKQREGGRWGKKGKDHFFPVGSHSKGETPVKISLRKKLHGLVESGDRKEAAPSITEIGPKQVSSFFCQLVLQ